ncbi:hypothetical protein [Alterisphingorhabdus coralli]|uniref:Uncharacterized protein n=1 Tax=Alterisphingorhabdus coralli TaxID=3071408 RepID=A0AA97I300_9SPHN|nr:hypothetical protein [Parasphingorhabdus sp. SCSIO 66989]WOE76758.1 hypothetical protein RB602_15340 [Parasphingorhabdus sp. SCSIO 66989]
MVSTRGVEPKLRRARLCAARRYVSGTICWKAILSGAWDRGEIVGQYLNQDATS